MVQEELSVFETWSVVSRFFTDICSLRTDEPVVYFEQGKLMHVNYDPHLVRLVREVRQLIVLGYKIPMKIQEAADLAKKFMRQAKALEQVSYINDSVTDCGFNTLFVFCWYIYFK